MPRKKQNRYGRTPLADAAEAGNYEKVKSELEEHPEDLDIPDAAGNTPLQCASLNGHDDIVALLIKNSCDIHCKNLDGDSPLIDAVENGHYRIVQLLLEAGVDPRARNARGDEPLQKINTDHRHADRIRDALMAARSKYSKLPAPPPAAQTPQYKAQESESGNRRGKGTRTNRTGQNSLYTRFDLASLRDAAARGDMEKTGSLLVVMANDSGIDDPESTLAAARGGHDEVLGLLLGLGNANPDPEPVKSAGSWDYATPMLAAIGGNNTGVIKLLLQQAKDGKLDPTKTFHGKTYYDIARDKAGPCWVEEERLLKEAYDEYKGRKAAGDPRVAVKQSKEDDQRRQSSRRNSRSGQADLSSPVRRAPGRARKDTAGVLEIEKPSKAERRRRASSPAENEPVKPRRKLVSGAELKGDREKTRTSAPASLQPRKPIDAAVEADSAVSRVAQGGDSKLKSDAKGQSKHLPHLDKKKGSGVNVRSSSPSKRPRVEYLKSSDAGEVASKRRRTEAAGKDNGHAERGRPKRDECRESAPRTMHAIERNVLKSDKDAKLSVSSKPTSRTGSVDHRPPSRGHQEAKMQVPKHSYQSLDELVASGKEAAERKAREEKARVERAASERPKKEAQSTDDTVLSNAGEEGIENGGSGPDQAEHAKPFDAQKRKAADDEEQRKHEMRVKKEAEEAKLEEQKRVAEAKVRKAMEDEQRKEEAERGRLQKEEEQRKHAQADAERLRQEEAKAERLAKLPPLIYWMETASGLANTSLAALFGTMQGVRGDTLKPELSGTEEGREQWVLNTHVALILGDKDFLEPSRLSAEGWKSILASPAAKASLWRIEADLYSMLTYELSFYNPALKLYITGPDTININPHHAISVRKAAYRQFMDTGLYFVKVSDLMAVVPRYPHLAGVKLVVEYHEAPPDNSGLDKFERPMPKWKSDPDAERYMGFAPGCKTYVDGKLVHQAMPQIATWSRTPTPVVSRRASRDENKDKAAPGKNLTKGSVGSQMPNDGMEKVPEKKPMVNGHVTDTDGDGDTTMEDVSEL